MINKKLIIALLSIVLIPFIAEYIGLHGGIVFIPLMILLICAVLYYYVITSIRMYKR